MPNDLNDLEAKIAQFKSGKASVVKRESDKLKDAENVNNGIRAGAELVVTIGAGVLIGYGLDSWLGTKPVFLIIFLLAGVFAGFFNIYRITQNIGSSVGYASLQKTEKDAKKAPEK
ncbi:MAG: AtpZ/AtpI family protein [Micavibrio aeruginosavorus]|uniref:AtpZ/AtpI family protein n=1 Tax=Micavibrio aeruginosavorus TaxID=349221 RepID=A0A7T5UGL2_9BACT|nr:MAG: AtpZ/AtpI family protein [Micavibrio aeruginosavorus]